MIATLAGGVLALAFAQSGGGSFVLEKQTIDGGGARSSGGTFVVAGTLGQPDAGPAPGGSMDGGSFRVRGGFWPQTGEPLPDGVFADGFED